MSAGVGQAAGVLLGGNIFRRALVGEWPQYQEYGNRFLCCDWKRAWMCCAASCGGRPGRDMCKSEGKVAANHCGDFEITYLIDLCC